MPQTPVDHKPRTLVTQISAGQRCTCCNILLIHPGTVIPGIGVFGPKCILNAQARAQDIEQGGLGELLRAGELRFPMLRESDTVFHLPSDAIGQYYVWAARLGLKLNNRIDGQECVLSVRPKSLQAFLKVKKAAQA